MRVYFVLLVLFAVLVAILRQVNVTELSNNRSTLAQNLVLAGSASIHSSESRLITKLNSGSEFPFVSLSASGKLLCICHESAKADRFEIRVKVVDWSRNEIVSSFFWRFPHAKALLQSIGFTDEQHILAISSKGSYCCWDLTKSEVVDQRLADSCEEFSAVWDGGQTIVTIYKSEGSDQISHFTKFERASREKTRISPCRVEKLVSDYTQIPELRQGWYQVLRNGLGWYHNYCDYYCDHGIVYRINEGDEFALVVGDEYVGTWPLRHTRNPSYFYGSFAPRLSSLPVSERLGGLFVTGTANASHYFNDRGRRSFVFGSIIRNSVPPYPFRRQDPAYTRYYSDGGYPYFRQHEAVGFGGPPLDITSMSPEGRYLAVCGSSTDYNVTVIDLLDGDSSWKRFDRDVGDWSKLRFGDCGWTVCFAKGNRVAIGLMDGTVEIWGL